MDVPFLRTPFPNAPLAFAHRGFSPAGCENSLAAFRAAVALGYGYVEADVRASRDGVPMLFHDALLDRVTDGAGPLSALTARQLRSVRIRGTEPIPTMAELLREWPRLKINVDLKDDASVPQLARLIEEHRAHERVLAASFSDRRRLRLLHGLGRPMASSPGRRTLLSLLSLRSPALMRRLARRRHIQCVQVPIRFRNIPVVTAGFIGRCHAAGLQVHVWTVNDAPTMAALLDMGVDGIMTDRADLLAGVLRERGVWPQYRPT